jgi:hypothetical protein
MRGGRASRQKGNRIERALVRALQHTGFAAERVPLSGAAHGRFGGDLSVPILGIDRRIEVKARCNGFRKLYAWLDGADLLVVRADSLRTISRPAITPCHGNRRTRQDRGVMTAASARDAANARVFQPAA